MTSDSRSDYKYSSLDRSIKPVPATACAEGELRCVNGNCITISQLCDKVFMIYLMVSTRNGKLNGIYKKKEKKNIYLRVKAQHISHFKLKFNFIRGVKLKHIISHCIFLISYVFLLLFLFIRAVEECEYNERLKKTVPYAREVIFLQNTIKSSS